ncbi:MAG: homoserine kinase [Acidobacteria bacterium]|nr:homoserine kinase [Acidobacteriota bacterium]
MRVSGAVSPDLTGARAIRIRVPATTSNLGPAFDAVGLALQLYLLVEVRRSDRAHSSLEFSGEDERLVPRDETNLIWQAMEEMARRHGKKLPSFDARVANQIPITKGLGSSAAACLAAAAGADFLCSLALPREEWLRFATELEGHPDNAAPALYGGLVATIGGETLLCSRAPFPSHWTVVTVTPELELATKKARAVLPAEVSHSDAVFNVQRTAFLMSQLIRGRTDGLREAMRDRLHQPYRSPLLPGLEEILAMDPRDGLIGLALSGAGSTVIALADSNERSIAAQISRIFAGHGLKATERLLKADNLGLTIEVLN